MGGLRGASAKADDEAPWKVAALGMYERHKVLNPTLELTPFDEYWGDCYDRRLDARVIGHYARLSDEPGFLTLCRAEIFPNLDEKQCFTEVELRDYFLMMSGDNLVSLQDKKGTGVWWMKRWKWDAKDKVLAHIW